MNRRDREIQAYATALFEAVVEETLKALRAVQQRLDEDEALRSLLENPAVDIQEKYEAIRKVVPEGAGEAVQKFLGLLISRQDISALDEIVDALQREVAARGEAPQVAEIISAVPLTDEERAQLEEKLRARFGENLAFRYKVDKDILGGLIVRVGDTLLDYSLRSRLEEVRGRLEAIV